MSKASYEITDASALEWCKRKTEEGIELRMTWDGGNDSGWVDFQIDGDRTDEDNEFIEFLTNKCYEELDYGSWAGDFSANGEAIFNPTENAFIGTDYYSEDDTITQECALRIAIPKDIWFDSVEIAIQDEEIRVNTDLVVRNGFKTPAHTEIENALDESIKDQVNEIVKEVELAGHEYRSMWEEVNLSKADFTLEGDELVHVVNSIGVGCYQTDEKDIFINLDNEE